MLIDFRDRRKEGETEGEKHGLAVSHMCANRGLNPQPTHVPLPGIKPMTFQFTG